MENLASCGRTCLWALTKAARWPVSSATAVVTTVAAGTTRGSAAFFGHSRGRGKMEVR
jgi:hypothetical protein